MSASPIIVWFRNDLRLRDHPALTAAVKSGSLIIPLYILDEEAAGRWTFGGASRWWLGKSLEALSADISRLGGRLILRRGHTERELKRIVEEAGASAVYFTREYEPWSIALEDRLHAYFERARVGFKRFGGRLLQEPEVTRTASGGAYRVYTPFWRAFSRDFTAPRASVEPKNLHAVPDTIASADVSAWKLLSEKPDWSGGLAETWKPGERGAQDRLEAFVGKHLSGYARGRDRLDKLETSRLSPHFAFGEISPAACWRAARSVADKSGASDQSIETFLKEIVWREFCYSLLLDFPDLPEKPIRSEFLAFEWADAANDLKAWQRGVTGYPIVDAGMRELWATGYMHNRARMIVASFLTKHLLLPWTYGEAWFWDTLVDADLANNAANWQWVAGCGADAAPYFRIFNPVLQGEKFDPNGDYVRRWVPELARLPTDKIHAPWTADVEILKAAGVRLGENYPRPIVDHKKARVRALAAYAKLNGR